MALEFRFKQNRKTVSIVRGLLGGGSWYSGFLLSTYTTLHVVISLVAIAAGLVVMAGMLQGKRLPLWTSLFLWTTVLTSVTGFGFPFERFLPSHYFGFISLAVLAIAILAAYSFDFAGPWRWLYVISAVMALYLNVFVLIVQLFLKISFLQPLAPTQSEPPFAIAQGWRCWCSCIWAMPASVGSIRRRREHAFPLRKQRGRARFTMRCSMCGATVIPAFARRPHRGRHPAPLQGSSHSRGVSRRGRAAGRQRGTHLAENGAPHHSRGCNARSPVIVECDAQARNPCAGR